jgi:hypothetical protein
MLLISGLAARRRGPPAPSGPAPGSRRRSDQEIRQLEGAGMRPLGQQERPTHLTGLPAMRQAKVDDRPDVLWLRVGAIDRARTQAEPQLLDSKLTCNAWLFFPAPHTRTRTNR